MKTKILLCLAIIAAMAALIYGYVQMSTEQAADKEADQPITAASRVQRDTHGGTVVTLDRDTQKLIGLQTASLAAATLPTEIKAYGRVLDPAPLAGLAGDVASGRAALDASGREYERLKTLAHSQNVSAKALEDAEAAMKHDQAAFAAAEAQLTSASGNAVADQPDLSAFVESLAKLETVLVRLDLPAGEWPEETPAGALVLPPGGHQPSAAGFLGRAATIDPQVQGEGFLFLVTNVPARLTPGLAVAGLLQLPGEPLHGAVVPDDAIVRSDDRAWFYVQTGDTTFGRREIILDHPVSGGWFVTNGVAPGDKVVTTGTQTLLSEERKTQIKLSD
jgi:hypothetical protein